MKSFDYKASLEKAIKNFQENYNDFIESIKPSLISAENHLNKAKDSYTLRYESMNAFLNQSGFIKPKDFDEFIWWFMERNENENGYIFPLPEINTYDFREFSEYKTSEFYNGIENKPKSYKIELGSGLYKYRFQEIEKVKNKTELLIGHFAHKKTPYIIAYLKYLEFDSYLLEHYCRTKEEMYDIISKILNVSKRDIKGNLLVMQPKSNEDKNRYNSHKYLKEVEKHYKSIKLGV